MTNEDALHDAWNELRQKLRHHWNQLTGEELECFHGDVQQLIDLVQRKTGEAREVIEGYVDELMMQAGAKLGRSADEIQELAQQSEAAIEEGAKQAVDLLRNSLRNVEAYARRRPLETIAFCFGGGLLAGLLLAATTRRR